MKNGDVYLNSENEEITITDIDGDMISYDLEYGMGDGQCRETLFQELFKKKTVSENKEGKQ